MVLRSPDQIDWEQERQWFEQACKCLNFVVFDVIELNQHKCDKSKWKCYTIICSWWPKPQKSREVCHNQKQKQRPDIIPERQSVFPMLPFTILSSISTISSAIFCRVPGLPSASLSLARTTNAKISSNNATINMLTCVVVSHNSCPNNWNLTRP